MMPLKVKAGVVGSNIIILQVITLVLCLKIHYRVVGPSKVDFHGGLGVLLRV